MKTTRWIVAALVAAMLQPLSAAVATPVAGVTATSALPEDSLQRISIPLTDQQGNRFTLADEQRPATIVTMFYGDCHSACPIAIESMKRLVDDLPANRRTGLRVVLISLNPGVDTPESLAHLAMMHGLPPEQFRFAVAGSDRDTREIAAALGVRYRRAAGGEINHSTRFVLLDDKGRVVSATDKSSVPPEPAFMASVTAQLGHVAAR
jgi:protein SCO1/2